MRLLSPTDHTLTRLAKRFRRNWRTTLATSATGLRLNPPSSP